MSLSGGAASLRTVEPRAPVDITAPERTAQPRLTLLPGLFGFPLPDTQQPRHPATPTFTQNQNSVLMLILLGWTGAC